MRKPLTIRININEPERFARICAELIRQGVIFTAEDREGDEDFEITLTGGF